MSHPNQGDVGVSMSERPHQCEDQDDVESESEVGLSPNSHCSTEYKLGESGSHGEQNVFHGGRPVPSVNSMKSDESKGYIINFTDGTNNPSPESLSSWSPSCKLSDDSSLVDTASPHTIEPGHILCAVCPKRAFKSCLTCMASFCEIHVKPHYSAPALQRHKLVEATEDLEQKLCSRHNRELELYCRTDQTPICVLCVATEHKGHDIRVWEETQEMHINTSDMQKTTAVPPPGSIEFTSVKPDSVCVCWGPPEGLTGPHRFRVSWTGDGRQEQLEVQDLKLLVQELTPGEKYTFTVATLSDDSRQSPCVSATVQTDIPPPESLTVDWHLTSVSVTWSKPAGVDQASYLLTLCSETLQTIYTTSLYHHFEWEAGREYSISVSAVLKGRQSKPISTTINTMYMTRKRKQPQPIQPHRTTVIREPSLEQQIPTMQQPQQQMYPASSPKSGVKVEILMVNDGKYFLLEGEVSILEDEESFSEGEGSFLEGE